ncbi:MAG: hypothetical protein HC874_17085 [Richelia sp. SL_2_1]|nr:hypothetical protein [Richelia sp. SL_2_1]
MGFCVVLGTDEVLVTLCGAALIESRSFRVTVLLAVFCLSEAALSDSGNFSGGLSVGTCSEGLTVLAGVEIV